MNFLNPKSMVGMDQILAILDYMKDNPQLAHSRFSRTKEGRSLLQQHWAACADLGNNVSPDCTQKTPDQWRTYYNAYKSKVKRKVKDMKAELVATGGAPTKKRLSDLENRLYLILGPDLGELLPRVCNTPVSLQRLETEHQPSSSTAEALLQDNTNFTLGSDSSDVELYYPEEHTGHLAVKTVGNIGQLSGDSVVHTDQRLEFVVHNVQPLEPVVHNVQQLEPVVHTDQRLEPVDHTVQQTVHAVHIDQQPERMVQVDQQLEPIVLAGQQPEDTTVCSGCSGQIKKGIVKGSPRRLRRRASSEQDGGGGAEPHTVTLLNVERMKIEAKQHATAAVHRLAGALEAIAERLGGPVRLQVTSPPRARRRYARISSSESD